MTFPESELGRVVIVVLPDRNYSLSKCVVLFLLFSHIFDTGEISTSSL